MNAKSVYHTPQLRDYGSVTDVTFQTPASGAVKGGQPNCSHLDKFVELSGLSGCD